MKFHKKDLLLYAITDRSWLGESTLYQQVEQALIGGATFIQLREKNLDEESFLKEALEIKGLCNRYNVPFVINDNVDIALKIGADGVHVGQSDMQANNVREILGNDKIIGVTAKTVEQALIAQKRGADYLGVGAVFSTSTKADAKGIDGNTFKAICNAVHIPVVAIGGINQENVSKLKGYGMNGVAVISGIFGQKDIKTATENLKKKVISTIE